MTDDIQIQLSAADIGGFDPHTQRLQILYSDPRLLVLEKRSAVEGEALTRPRMFADLRQMSVFDALLLAHTNHASGSLVVQLADKVTKRIYIKNGDVVFAESTVLDDRLGESLIRAGHITQAQLDDAAKAITPTHKLGKILVERHLISPKDLYQGVRRQVEEIVIGLVGQSHGRMAFYEGIDPRADVVALTLDTQHLLMDGLRRSAVWGSLSDTVPEREIYLTLDTNPRTVGLNADEQNLLAYVGEGISMRHLIELGGLGNLHTYHHVHRLLLRGVLCVRVMPPEQQPKVERARRKQVERALEQFALTVREICDALATQADPAALRMSLDSFYQSPPEIVRVVLKGVDFREGAIDSDRILQNLQELDSAERAESLDRACTELLHFLAFESHHLVNQDVARQVSALVHKFARR